MKIDTEFEIINLIENYNVPNLWGFYKNVSAKGFSLEKIPLDDLQVDTLMNDFFITFNVNAGNYFTSNHFPKNRNILNKLFFYLKTKQGKAVPITVILLQDAVVSGIWLYY